MIVLLSNIGRVEDEHADDFEALIFSNSFANLGQEKFLLLAEDIDICVYLSIYIFIYLFIYLYHEKSILLGRGK